MCHHCQGGWVVAGDYQKIFRAIFQNCIDLVKICRRLFDSNYFVELTSYAKCGLSFNIGGGAAWYIIYDHRQWCVVIQYFVMLKNSFLCWFVIIRTCCKQGIYAIKIVSFQSLKQDFRSEERRVGKEYSFRWWSCL